MVDDYQPQIDALKSQISDYDRQIADLKARDAEVRARYPGKIPNQIPNADREALRSGFAISELRERQKKAQLRLNSYQYAQNTGASSTALLNAAVRSENRTVQYTPATTEPKASDIVTATVAGKTFTGTRAFYEKKVAEEVSKQTAFQVSQAFRLREYIVADEKAKAESNQRLTAARAEVFNQAAPFNPKQFTAPPAAKPVVPATPPPSASGFLSSFTAAKEFVTSKFSRLDSAYARARPEELAASREQGVFFGRVADSLSRVNERLDEKKTGVAGFIQRVNLPARQAKSQVKLLVSGTEKVFRGLSAYGTGFAEKPVSTAAKAAVLTSYKFTPLGKLNVPYRLARSFFVGSYTAPDAVIGYRKASGDPAYSAFRQDKVAIGLVTTASRENDALNQDLGSFKARYRSELVKAGYTGDINKAVELGAYERRTRTYASLAGGIVGAETAGNIGGDYGIAKFGSKFFTKLPSGYFKTFVQSGTAIALTGGTTEGLLQVKLQSRIEQRPATLLEYGRGAVIGAASSFIPGGLVYAGQKSRLVRLGSGSFKAGVRSQTKKGTGFAADVFANVADPPESVGDYFTKRYEEGAGVRVPVVAVSSARYTGDVSGEFSYNKATGVYSVPGAGARAAPKSTFKASVVPFTKAPAAPTLRKAVFVSQARPALTPPRPPPRSPSPSPSRAVLPSKTPPQSLVRVPPSSKVPTKALVKVPAPVRVQSPVQAQVPIRPNVRVDTNVRVPIVGDGGGFPILPLRGGGGSGFKFVRTSQPRAYTPSFYALGLNIKGKKPSRLSIKTGLGVRPIIGGQVVRRKR